MGRRTGVRQADEDDLRLHAEVGGARVQRRLEGIARVQAAAHVQKCQMSVLRSSRPPRACCPPQAAPQERDHMATGYYAGSMG